MNTWQWLPSKEALMMQPSDRWVSLFSMICYHLLKWNTFLSQKTDTRPVLSPRLAEVLTILNDNSNETIDAYVNFTNSHEEEILQGLLVEACLKYCRISTQIAIKYVALFSFRVGECKRFRNSGTRSVIVVQVEPGRCHWLIMCNIF